MYLTSAQLLTDFNTLANFAFALVVLQALRKTPWRCVLRFERLNIFLAGCAFLLVLWSLRAGVSPGLALHYLGMTTLTLVFGWPLAILGASGVLFAMGLIHGMDWSAFGVNALVTVVVPVLVTWQVFRLVDRKLPPNFFIYLYLCAFLGAILAIVASAVIVMGLLSVSGAYSMGKIGHEYLAYLPLLALPEGIINGMVMTVLVALRPDWVATFDEERHLGTR